MFQERRALNAVSILDFDKLLYAKLQRVSYRQFFYPTPIEFFPVLRSPRSTDRGEFCLRKPLSFFTTLQYFTQINLVRTSIRFLICRHQVGPFTFTVVFVIRSTSLRGTLRALRSILLTLVGSGAKNCRKRGTYGSRSLDWRSGIFALIESTSSAGAAPLLTPSRKRTPIVRTSS